MYKDSYRHKGLRIRLVNEIREKGFHNEEVLKAIEKVPRHAFLDSSFVKFAYRDIAFPIGAGQTISQPSTVALQTHLLNITKGAKVLEIGTGSGYQAAILSEMKVQIYSIERQEELYQKTSRLLNSFNYKRLRLFLGDGYKGLPGYAPFDAILITAGAVNIPQDLLLQLKIGGVMVVPIGQKLQTMTRIRRLDNNEFEKEEFGECAFVPMLNGVAAKQVFP